MYDGFYSTEAVEPEDEIPPELYSTLSDRDHHYERGGEGGEVREREEEEGGEGNDALTALDASFETRRDMLGRNRIGRADRGLSFLADDIVDRFHKVAISKHRVEPGGADCH
ncbi:hypothetical protein GBAR_LOCUS28358 [Geodia barretti]|uniref:Uncharacterized protein n=1 Tax=Geodia barretti TaxID=519541 RepID=A0AA35XBY8_GEOBA|nr:hypothetical protein GBAR_LOCUS28358 [Geodia barretti]